MPLELPAGTASYYEDENPPPSGGQLLRFLLLVGGGILLIIIGVIWFVENLVWWIPPGVEAQLGTLMQAQFEFAAESSPTSVTLNQLLNQLEEYLPDREERNFRVLYVPESDVNALALPGSQIVVFRGLLEEVTSENELAMVLGHELGHFANRDHLRGLVRNLTVQVMLATFLGDGSAIQSLAASGVSVISQSQFSQQQERQADEFGLHLLNQLYGHVSGATDFFERLAEKQGAVGQIDLLLSHPAPAKRVRHMQRLIQDEGYIIGERTPLPDSLELE